MTSYEFANYIQRSTYVSLLDPAPTPASLHPDLTNIQERIFLLPGKLIDFVFGELRVIWSVMSQRQSGKQKVIANFSKWMSKPWILLRIRRRIMNLYLCNKVNLLTVCFSQTHLLRHKCFLVSLSMTWTLATLKLRKGALIFIAMSSNRMVPCVCHMSWILKWLLKQFYCICKTLVNQIFWSDNLDWSIDSRLGSWCMRSGSGSSQLWMKQMIFNCHWQIQTYTSFSTRLEILTFDLWNSI